jgi:hypothetical protein
LADRGLEGARGSVDFSSHSRKIAHAPIAVVE